MTNDNQTYLHGFSNAEQTRLRSQAEFLEQLVYKDIDFSGSQKILEIGCGVGAQTDILLRRFPNLNIEGIDLNTEQIDSANKYLSSKNHYKNRYHLSEMNAQDLDFESDSLDGAFLCWVLEHVPEPLKVLSEARRVLKKGSVVYVTEVMNHSFFLDPYSPNTWKYWQAFNDYQYEHAGDPFIGAKLGNLLSSVGFNNVETNVKHWHLDNRLPKKRKATLDYWNELLLSGADTLIKANVVTKEIVENTKKELNKVSKDPNAVFMYSFMQAKAIV
jgi:ubiquinone/menaquinone biosynthesis C-methylase UbiE